MKKLNVLQLSILGLVSMAGAGAYAAADDAKTTLAKPYVTVNGIAQPNARAEILLREQFVRGVQDSQQLREGVREVLINQTLMEQEARKAGLDKDALVQAQMDLARQTILAQAWQQKILGELTIKDEDIKAEYEAQIARLGEKEYRIRHLLVTDESTAKLLHEKIQSGSKIDDLAKEYSQDAGTRDKGGLADWTVAGALLPPLADQIGKLGKGQLAAQPVKTSSGWHVIQLEDIRPFKAPSLEELKPQLTQIIARKALDAQVKALRDKAKIQ